MLTIENTTENQHILDNICSQFNTLTNSQISGRYTLHAAAKFYTCNSQGWYILITYGSTETFRWHYNCHEMCLVSDQRIFPWSEGLDFLSAKLNYHFNLKYDPTYHC